MTQSLIFQPFLGMMLLNLAVATYMYIRRLSYLHVNRIDPATLSTPRSGARIIPDDVSLPAYNLHNLVELPILFYALCIYLYVTRNVDTVYVACAWWFLLFRVSHSLVHCTINNVPMRFTVYVLSSLGLWVMVARAAIGAFHS